MPCRPRRDPRNTSRLVLALAVRNIGTKGGLEIDTVSSPMQMHKLFAWERGGQIESVDSKAED